MTPIRLIALLFVFLWSGCAHLPPEKQSSRPFQFSIDRLGFSNETVWSYGDGEIKSERDHHQTTGEHYTRRCFVVSRSVVQFWKFARFEPSRPALDEKALAQRIREVTSIDVWKEPLPFEKRIVFTGYANLPQISAAHPKTFQANLGLGWPVYCRVGNMPMIIPPTRSHQENLFHEIVNDLHQGYPTIAWLVDFPGLRINHAATIYSILKDNPQKTVFLIYDPNDHLAPKKLTYNKKERSFYFQKTFYFKGGKIDVRPLYRSPIQ
ncbi:MAG: hypothetical protein V4507_07685 [Verrucomicrobiota bacterium]